MRERPILFSAPMVRAILAGTKTQTRRAMKPQPEAIPDDVARVQPYDATGYWWPSNRARAMVTMHDAPQLCPYGQPGDRLWVRETFSPFTRWGNPCSIAEACYVVLVDGTQVYRDPPEIYPGLPKYAPGSADHIKWRPSIHMPWWASRLTLEVTSVRVERLHDISEEDARAEGVVGPTNELFTARRRFEQLWESINGAESWEANPWVWVVGFEGR